MTIAYVVRHGETDWNRAGRYQGQRESTLTDLGRAQAQALDAAFAEHPVERIIASPLARCRDTAAPLAARHGLWVETDPRLIEIAHGTWEGRLRDEIARDDADLMVRWREHPERVRFPGGESLEDVRARWNAFAAEMNGNKELVIVTHDVLVRIAVLTATGADMGRFWEPRVCNGAYARFAIEGQSWRLLDECVDGHLGALLADPGSQAL